MRIIRNKNKIKYLPKGKKNTNTAIGTNLNVKKQDKIKKIDPQNSKSVLSLYIFKRLSFQSFIFFVSILLCMFILESNRFSLYFNRQSSEFEPTSFITSSIANIISNISLYSGVSAFMQLLDDTNHALAQEYTIQTDGESSVFMQFGSFIKRELNFFFTKSDDTNSYSIEEYTYNKQLFLEFDLLALRQKQIYDFERSKLKIAGNDNELEVIAMEKEAYSIFEKRFDENISDEEKLLQNLYLGIAPITYEDSEKLLELDKSIFYNPKHLKTTENSSALHEYNAQIPDYIKKTKVLLIGDSMMMEGLGTGLQSLLSKRDDLVVVRVGRHSTGLVIPKYFDWPNELEKLLEKHNPDILIVSLGANDTQKIIIDNITYPIGTEDWINIYNNYTFDFLTRFAIDQDGVDYIFERMKEEQQSRNVQNGCIEDIAEHSDSNVDSIENSIDLKLTMPPEEHIFKRDVLSKMQVLWVGFPIVQPVNYAKNASTVTAVHKEMVSYFDNIHFIGIDHLLTDSQGQYRTYMQGANNKSIRLRNNDGIHVSRDGGNILAKFIEPTIDKTIGILQLQSLQKEPLYMLNSRKNYNRLLDENNSLILPPIPGYANIIEFASQYQNITAKYSIFLPRITNDNNNGVGDSDDYQAEEQKNSSTKTAIVPKLIENIMGSHGKTFPVIYLLHSEYEYNTSYNDKFGKKLQNIADEKQVIIVCPYANSLGLYVDFTNQNVQTAYNNMVESFMIKELIPHIDAIYPTDGKRAIAGVSMGGHGAFLLGLKYPNIFNSIASISGIVSFTEDNTKHLNTLLERHNLNIEALNQYSILNILKKNSYRKTSQYIIQCINTTDDLYIKNENEQLKNILLKYNFDINYKEDDDKHQWSYWSVEIPSSLRLQANYLNGL